MPASLAFCTLPGPLSPKLLRAFRADAGWDQDTDALRGPLRPGGVVEWVAVQAGKKTVGIARLELAPPEFCYVSELVVLSAYRGRGIGEWFMQQIESRSLAAGIPRVLLQPADAARAFYEKLNFVADPRVAGFMKKELGPRRRFTLPGQG